MSLPQPLPEPFDAPLAAFAEEPDILAQALTHRQVGLALIDEGLRVVRRDGALSDWLPGEGGAACESPLLLNMEESLAALKEKGGEIVLPSMRLPAEENMRVTIWVSWSPSSRHFIVVTTPDYGGDHIERHLEAERRMKQLLQQQADAAVAGKRHADTLYKDAVERSNDLIFRFTEDYTIAFANSAAAQFLGKTQNALLGENLKTQFPTASWEVDVAAERVATLDMVARNADGQAICLEWKLRALGPDGENEFQAAARDVTAERRLRIERERANEEAREAAVANERLRIAHDLHDTLVRSIVSLVAQTRLIARTTGDAETKAALDEMEALARDGLTETREAIMQMRATRPSSIDMKAIVDAFAARPGAPKVEATFDLDNAVVPQETEQLFASILREALRNIELHACAGKVRVALKADRQSMRLDIEDDGAGFNALEPTPGHFGVVGMRERAKLAGATLGLNSAPGHGTRITLISPLPTV